MAEQRRNPGARGDGRDQVPQEGSGEDDEASGPGVHAAGGAPGYVCWAQRVWGLQGGTGAFHHIHGNLYLLSFSERKTR